MYDGFVDPWDDEVIAEGTEEWRKARAIMDAVYKLADWLEDDLPANFAEMLDRRNSGKTVLTWKECGGCQASAFFPSGVRIPFGKFFLPIPTRQVSIHIPSWPHLSDLAQRLAIPGPSH